MRYLDDAVRRFASDKFVLVTGPRQVGKTTLARAWLEPHGGRYFNWDVPADREALLRGRFLEPPPRALVLDEIHKYPRWKSWLKGLYDRSGAYIPTVVTGSARLDVYRRGGDSMFGRFEQLRLHPLSIAELGHHHPSPPPADWLRVGSGTAHDESLWQRLARRGGFPEPYYRDEATQHRRWLTQRRTLLVREDLRDLTRIREVALVEHLVLLLPGRVGSPLSVNALREELEVGHDTVSSWLEVLERLYLCYRIAPYSKRLNRALKKERKLYLWDWSDVEDPGARLENMVASHLLKAVHYWNDLGHGEFDLQYIRDKEKREVDFVITERRRPVVLIEAKLSDDRPTESLNHFRDALDRIPALQLIGTPGVDRTLRGIRVVTAGTFLSGLV